MRVSQLHMENFRCFEKKTIETPAPRAFFLGDNGVGKSTCFDALRWLMLGVCRGLDKKGRGVEDAILRLGTPSRTVVVSGVVSHGGKDYTLTRTWLNGQSQFRVAEWSGSSSAQQQEWLDLLGVSAEGLSALLDSETFFSLDGAEAKTLVLSFMKVTVELADGTFIDLEELEKRFEGAFARRRDATRDLKTLPIPVQPAEKTGDIADIEARLSALGVEREALVVQRASQQGEGVAYLQQFNDLEGALAGIRSKLTSMPDVQADIAAMDARSAESQAELETVTAALGALQVSGGDFDALIAKATALKGHTPSKGCVLSENIKCPVKSSAFKDEAKAIETLAEELREANGERSKLILTQSGLTSTIAALARDHQALVDKDAARQRVLDEELSTMAKMDELSPKLPSSVADTSQIDGQITALDERIQKGTDILRKHRELKVAWETFEKQKSARDTVSKSLDAAVADVQTYGPDGVRVPALAKVIPAFEASVNASLKPFGYTLSVSSDPWELRINGLRYVTLSASEKMRVGIALQIALAQTSGVRFTLIDQVEMLLTAPRTVMSKLLLSNDNGLDQVWLARAFEPNSADPVIAGTTMVRL